MTRKDIEEKFVIIGNNSELSLFTKKENSNRAANYVATVSLTRGKIHFNGKTFSDLDEFEVEAKKWAESLPWPVDTYSPFYNERCRLENRLSWYLTEKLGFSANWESRSLSYTRKIGEDCTLSFSFDNRDVKENETSIYSQLGPYTFITSVKDADEGVSIITTIVRNSVLGMATDMIDLLGRLPDKTTTEINTYIRNNRNIFGFEKVDFKSIMIDSLEKQLKALKG